MQYLYLAATGLAVVGLYRWRRAVMTLVRYGFQPADTMIILPGRRAVAIDVIRGGEPYRIYLPYSSLSAVKMSNHRAFAVKDGHSTPIQQPVGVRYFVTADDLGVTSINLLYDDGSSRQFSGSQPVTL